MVKRFNIFSKAHVPLRCLKYLVKYSFIEHLPPIILYGKKKQAGPYLRKKHVVKFVERCFSEKIRLGSFIVQGNFERYWYFCVQELEMKILNIRRYILSFFRAT